MARVIAYRDKTTGELESVDSMLKRFKKQVLNDNIMYECKRREFFIKKGLKRKMKSEEAQKRLRAKKKKYSK